jgi:putative heme-binding domain-containing protein
MAGDPDARVRFQCALSLGEFHNAKIIPALVKVASTDLDDKWSRAAVLSSIKGLESRFFHEFVPAAAQSHRESLSPMMTELGQMVAASTPLDGLGSVLRGILPSKGSSDLAWQMAAINGFANGLRTRGMGSKERSPLNSLIDEDSGDLRQRVDAVFHRAAELAADAGQPLSSRVTAIALLGQADYGLAGKTLEALVEPQQAAEIQTAAIRALGQLSSAEAGAVLVTRSRWSAYTPAVRDAVLSALMVNNNFLASLLSAIEAGDVPAWTVNADRRNQLMKHKEEAIRNRATALFKDLVPGDRMKVYEESKSALALHGDSKNGHAVFQKNCIPCHVFAGEGKTVGPDLTGIRNQPAEVLLLHIIVPEYEIMPTYTCYNVETREGDGFTGLLAAETPTTITLRLAQGIEQQIPRSTISSITTSRLSLMPQELEKTMTRQELADLIAFLKGE